MSKIYVLSISGRPQRNLEEPGQVAKAIEAEVGRKLRGKENIVPQLAKMKPGDSKIFEAGISVTVQEGTVPALPEPPVGGVEVPEQPTANTPVEPSEDDMTEKKAPEQEEIEQEKEQEQEKKSQDYTPADELETTDPAERVEAGKKEAEAKGLEPADEGEGESDEPQSQNFVPPGEYVPDPSRS